MLLDLFGIPRWLQIVDCLNLVEVDFNSVVCDHVTQKRPLSNTKRAFGSVKS